MRGTLGSSIQDEGKVTELHSSYIINHSSTPVECKNKQHRLSIGEQLSELTAAAAAAASPPLSPVNVICGPELIKGRVRFRASHASPVINRPLLDLSITSTRFSKVPFLSNWEHLSDLVWRYESILHCFEDSWWYT